MKWPCFFKNARELMAKYTFPPTHVYNIDETNPYSSTKRSEKGQLCHRVGEKQELLILHCECTWHFYAFDIYLFSTDYGFTCGKSCPCSCYKSGWTIEELFLVWLCHFMWTAKHQPENPFLLIPDGHNSTNVCSPNLADKMALWFLLSCPVLYRDFHPLISHSLEQ